MTNTYIYANREVEESDASGVSGLLCRDSEGGYFFRVYHSDHSFEDFELLHDDLPITIAPNSFASFYRDRDHKILDHSPEVLGLERK